MSHTSTRPGRKGRQEAPEATEPTTEPTSEQTTDQPTGEQTGEQKPDAAVITPDMVNLAVEAPVDFRATVAPVRARNDAQKAMDAVATKAYESWIAADRPTLWQKMPVITYFLTPEQVNPMRTLIRRAGEYVVPQGDDTGVRIRFGKEFVLTEEKAKQIEQPEAAGRTVLAWAAIAKRQRKTDETSANVTEDNSGES